MADYWNFGVLPLQYPLLDHSWMSNIGKMGNFQPKTVSTGQLLGGQLVGNVGSLATNWLSSRADTELGLDISGIVGSGVGSAFSGLSNNLIKGSALTQGLGLNVGASVAGTALGVAGKYAGRGITNAMGDTKVGRGVGAGVSSIVGNVGGAVASTAIRNIGLGAQAMKSGLSSLGGGMSIGGMAGQAVGAALSAANGPSHAYQGKYGKITKGMDTAYDAIQTAIGFVPGWGLLVSGLMAVNKGLTNVFGSTDGQTKQDAILGSAFAGPLNWINMAGARTTNTFGNQSWQNTERTDSFMQDAFGRLGDRFADAREQAGKVYGTFSRKAFKKALKNLNFANNAWGKILDMTNQNEYLNIRANDMASLNTDRYALMIQGGIGLMARGKNGMKILSFATTGGYQDTGMRLLSRAALNSSGMRILSNAAI